MNRRDFLKGFVASAAGLLLPVDAEPAKRVYALDQTMIPRKNGILLRDTFYPPTDYIDVLEPYDTLLIDHIVGQLSTKGWISRGPGLYKVFSDEELHSPYLEWVVSPEEVLVQVQESYHSILLPEPNLRMSDPD